MHTIDLCIWFLLQITHVTQWYILDVYVTPAENIHMIFLVKELAWILIIPGLFSDMHILEYIEKYYM